MFHLIEIHDGDSNDNHITDIIIEADTKEQAMMHLETDFLEECKKAGIDPDIDGDEDVTYIMWSEYYSEDGDILSPDEDDIDDETASEIFHHDFYWQASYATEDEARNQHSRYHDLLVIYSPEQKEST